MLRDVQTMAERIGTALRARRQKLAVADGATGGLISAALLTAGGASRFYVGGGVVYSLGGRSLLLGMSDADLAGQKAVSEAYALLQAEAIARNFGAHWGVAETGCAGPDPHPYGIEAGVSAIAVHGPGVARTRIIRTGRTARIDNMEAFARAALELLVEALEDERA